METYTRYLQAPILSAIKDTPAIVVVGARQSGKSTLAAELQRSGNFFDYYNLDDLTTLYAAKASPLDFLAASSGNIIIDEIQRAPELFLSIKKLVDEDRRPGRFLLTGSANVLNLPKMADSLAGRMEIHTLWPLSQGEIQRTPEHFLKNIFSVKFPRDIKPIYWHELVKIMLLGGYPEVLARKEQDRRTQWYKAYVMAMVQRDIRELANIEGLIEIPNLLVILANRAANLINYTDISRISGINAVTLKRYIALFNNTFLTVMLPAWASQAEKRIVKAPKVFINDTGLLCFLRKYTEELLLTDKSFSGAVLENFVVMELYKQKGWSVQPIEMFHFRNHDGYEVDLVLEAQNGKIAGIEIKASSTIRQDDFKGLNALKAIAGKKFHRGIVLYMGEKVLSFAHEMWAVPVSALWH